MNFYTQKKTHSNKIFSTQRSLPSRFRRQLSTLF